ncbi:MAG: hypothetical protein JST22_05995 [Bacteroidetes bacterium]|nr:hypothetical protein [Bacteroidota bacterium]
MLTFLLLPVLVAVVNAQPSDTIITNPKAELLRSVWAVYGNAAGGDYVGQGIGAIPDINGDGIAEFAVYYGAVHEWRIYYGSAGTIPTTPSVTLRGYGSMTSHAVAGDFWGTGHPAVVLPRTVRDTFNGKPTDFWTLEFLRSESGGLDTIPSLRLDPRMMNPRTLWTAEQIEGIDLDGDGADELIVYLPGLFRGTVPNYNPEVWIYRGGSNFQVDSPTVILRDDEPAGGGGYQRLFVGHWDEDRWMDIATTCDYDNGLSQKLKFWFGSSGSPWNWSAPQHEIAIDNHFMAALDCDGDGVLDVALPPADSFRVRLYRSNAGKSIHTRSLAPADADVLYYRDEYAMPVRLGYLSDSAGRYEMLGIFGHSPVLGLSGGPGGPDHTADVYSDAGVFGLIQPLGDVTGDGRNDLIASYYPDNRNAGIAVVFAGGPYIPGDPAAVLKLLQLPACMTLPVSGPTPHAMKCTSHGGAIFRRCPNGLPSTIFKAARLHMATCRQGVVKRCGIAQASLGVYLLCLYDAQHRLMTTTRIAKQ